MSSLVITAATLDDEYNNNTNYNNNASNNNANNHNANNNNANNNNANNNNSATCKKNQTYKNKNSQKIDKTMLQQLYNSNNSNNSNNDDSYDMGDFVPVQKTMHNANIQQQVLNSNTKYNEVLDDDDVVRKTNLEMSKDNEIYKQFINNYNNSIEKDLYNSNYLNTSTSNNDLIKRLDKILYLLEEDKNDQNHLITEELILYVFLGVFIIYVLDSFVKAGKYVR
jgi:hypothetical protein